MPNLKATLDALDDSIDPAFVGPVLAAAMSAAARIGIDAFDEARKTLTDDDRDECLAQLDPGE